MSGERDVRVTVWGQQLTISVYQKSKSVWIAMGEYMGKTIEVRGASKGAVTSLWRRTAEYRGN